MRFPQLPLGARFEYQGRTLVKTGPMVATPEGSGPPQMMPRWADVSPLGDTPRGTAGAGPRRLDERRVKDAFAIYHDRCRELLQQATGGGAEPTALAADLDRAGAEFLARIEP